MNKPNPKVDGFLRKAKKWREELQQLRRIILNCGLTEEVKWRAPCYTNEGRNILLINGFKEYCVLMFVKGALFKDPKGLLSKPGENTQSTRWLRFTSVQQIVEMEPVLKAYIHEAVKIEKAGLKVELKKITDQAIPEEFQQKLDELPELKIAFEELTPGRRRGYLLYFSAAKQSKTRTSRIEKSIPQILSRKGMND